MRLQLFSNTRGSTTKLCDLSGCNLVDQCSLNFMVRQEGLLCKIPVFNGQELTFSPQLSCF